MVCTASMCEEYHIYECDLAKPQEGPEVSSDITPTNRAAFRIDCTPTKGPRFRDSSFYGHKGSSHLFLSQVLALGV